MLISAFSGPTTTINYTLRPQGISTQFLTVTRTWQAEEVGAVLGFAARLVMLFSMHPMKNCHSSGDIITS
jgi:hypothetical protein